ncbi:GNAT family N-acetyltransferase [Streptomyces pathocidini]|uniref:GNAT family N-acetyltransferase n=1 Tax=Streptomyces pathocidini TaxID=1650571 RepID=UPI003411B490
MTRIDLVYSLSEIDESELAPLTQGRSFYVSGPWLRAYESLRTPDVVYVTHRDDMGRLDGLLPLYRQRPDTLAPYDAFGTYLRGAGEFAEADWSPSLVLGQSAAYCNEFLIVADAGPGAESSVVADLLRAAEEQRMRWGVPAASVLYLNREGARQLAAVPGTPQPFICDVECEIDVEWDSWDGYIQYLHSLGRKRSASARRETEEFQGAGYTVSPARLGGLLEESNRLFTKLQDKYGDRTTMAERAHYLKILAAEADSHSRLFVLRRDEEILGISLAFLWGDTVYMRQLGLDYERLTGAAEYFNLTIYEPIRFAIDHGYRRVHLGRASYDAKMFRGAKVRPLIGACWSATAESPLAQAPFAAWNRRRAEVAESGDRKLVMAAFGPR